MTNETKKLKAQDRVKRINIPGCLGTVKEIKNEVTAKSQDSREKNLMVSVQWDNGTVSYMTPDALEIIS